jgi:beta-N-acetylhexosaminidase
MTTQFTDLKAIIVDASGAVLTAEEEALFSRERPAGYILFKRNCISKQQVADLVASFRRCSGRDDIPVLIDQEGGTVARLREPEFREYPPARHFADLIKSQGLQKAIEATRENSRLMGAALAEMGITVNCAPVADVPAPDCHAFLAASRTYGDDAEEISQLAEAVCRGLLDSAVTPVIKHIPGHGRAKVDSHFALPVTDASFPELSKTDFKPFKYLAQTDMKTALWAMAAHVVYSALDPDSAATISRKVTENVIRGHMGFDGVLLADDISMKALGGTLEDRVALTMAAGMDLTMLCNASFEDRVAALAATPRVSPDAAARLERAELGRKSGLKQG